MVLLTMQHMTEVGIKIYLLMSISACFFRHRNDALIAPPPKACSFKEILASFMLKLWQPLNYCQGGLK